MEGYKSNDLWSYSVKDNKWYLLEKGDFCGPDVWGTGEIDDATIISPSASPKELKKINIPVHDGIDRPCQRIGARMIFNTESLSLYMHGGMDINNEALNDMWIFSLEKSAWSKVY